MSTLAGTLRSWVVEDVVVGRRARAAVGVAAFALAVSFGGQVAVAVPLTPVPITLQTFFVILAGVMLGPRLGALSMGVYVAVGAMGAPVFSNGAGGLPWLLGPTGGYLLAAPPAAFVAGYVAGRSGQVFRTLAGLTLGVLTMYVGGISWLLVLTGEPLAGVMALGVLPFVSGDVAKTLVAAWVVRVTRHTTFHRL